MTYNDLRKLLLSKNRAPNTEGKALGYYTYGTFNDDGTIIVGGAMTMAEADVPEGWHRNTDGTPRARVIPSIVVTPDDVLRCLHPHIHGQALRHVFEIAVLKDNTTKRRGQLKIIDNRLSWKHRERPENMSYIEPETGLEYDLKARKALNPTAHEWKWDREGQNEFNRWMRELRKPFEVAAKLGILVNHVSDPKIIDGKLAKYLAELGEVYSGKYTDPLTVFKNIDFDNAESVRDFVQFMPNQFIWNSGGKSYYTRGEGNPELQLKGVRSVFNKNRRKLQEQFGALKKVAV